METIRNYLESMFASLPNTGEVRRAKEELWQMMEDKYSELLAEGKMENEAVGIIISEFGNLDELADLLGITRELAAAESQAKRQVSLEEVRDYLRQYSRQKLTLAVAVMLFIISPTGLIVSSLDIWKHDMEYAGLIFFFISIALGVGLIVYPSILMGRWDFIEKEAWMMDYATSEYVSHRLENGRVRSALLLTVGIFLCICSVLPPAIGSFLAEGLYEEASPVFLFFMVGLGVAMIIYGASLKEGCRRLLKRNGALGCRARIHPWGAIDDDDTYIFDDKRLAAVMSVYWPTVTCIYLLTSFMTFCWHITWIIWVIAGIVYNFIGNAFGRKE